MADAGDAPGGGLARRRRRPHRRWPSLGPRDGGVGGAHAGGVVGRRP